MERLGSGSEGIIYKVDNETVYKKFRIYNPQKLEKLEMLKKINLENFVKINNILNDGYTMQYIKTDSLKSVKKALNEYISLDEKIEYIKQVEKCQKEAHKNGIVLVDNYHHNFLINKDKKVIGVDIDNFQVEDFECNLKPVYFYDFYYKKINSKEITPDLDKVCNLLFFLEGVASPTFNARRINNYIKGDKIIEEYIDNLLISKELKELFKEIVSDSQDKPYLNDSIDELKSSEEFIYSKSINT